jgi:hypothetical protein
MASGWTNAHVPRVKIGGRSEDGIAPTARDKIALRQGIAGSLPVPYFKFFVLLDEIERRISGLPNWHGFRACIFSSYLQAMHPKRKFGTNGLSDGDGPRALRIATASEVPGRCK